MTTSFQSSWHGIRACTLESDSLRTVLLPELGGKIASLYDKASQYEWLAPPMRALKTPGYGADFVDQDMSGWDEMLPTIDACQYAGFDLPDHGEVWSVPWQMVEQAVDEIGLSVEGRALPCRLTRRARFATPRCLELRYELVNGGTAPYPILWAAHPQFVADAQTRLLLPPEVKQVVNVKERGPWSPPGARFPWPRASSNDGRAWELDRVRAVDNKDSRKFYLPPEQRVHWAGLSHEGLGCQLRLEWSPEALPYLGIWVDEGEYNKVPVAALEPTNGYYDRLDRSTGNGSAPILAPGKPLRWTLKVTLSHEKPAHNTG